MITHVSRMNKRLIASLHPGRLIPRYYIFPFSRYENGDPFEYLCWREWLGRKWGVRMVAVAREDY
jgi:hypothetical protein